MSRIKIVNAKVKVLIRAYLLANKGKKCKGAEIANYINYINNNCFGLNQHNVTSQEIAKHIKLGKTNNANVLYPVTIEKIGGINYYSL